MLHLHALGHFHPDNVIDNAFLESLDIGTSEEWILSRVGIHERHTVLSLDYIRQTKNADVRAAAEGATISNPASGARAARLALERAGLKAEDIGMVVSGGCSPQWQAPAEASTVACELGIEVPCFDMHAACSTFGLQLGVLDSMGAALPDYVLALCLENNTRAVDYRDRAGCVLWGDGVSAAIVSAKHPGRATVVSHSFGGAPSGASDVHIQRTGHFAQDGAKVHKFAVKRMSQLFNDVRSSLPAGQGRELVYVGHQANLTMLHSVAKRCDVAPERHWFNIDKFGNQGSAGAPAVLSQRWNEIPDGTRVATIVVGAGLSWSHVLLQF